MATSPDDGTEPAAERIAGLGRKCRGEWLDHGGPCILSTPTARPASGRPIDLSYRRERSDGFLTVQRSPDSKGARGQGRTLRRACAQRGFSCAGTAASLLAVGADSEFPQESVTDDLHMAVWKSPDWSIVIWACGWARPVASRSAISS